MRFRKEFAILCTIAALLTGVVGGSLAYLVTNTAPVVNQFVPGKVPPEVNETFENNVKSDVSFTNTGNVDAYIRATVVTYWTDLDGNVVSQPEGYSFEITYSNDEKWQEGQDGYYYYTDRVKPDNATSVLIEKATWEHPENPQYKLVMDVLAQSIQADPFTSHNEAWAATDAPVTQ